MKWRRYSTNLPANVDLLERYRGLVALGRIQEDEEQIRVIMQVRHFVSQTLQERTRMLAWLGFCVQQPSKYFGVNDVLVLICQSLDCSLLSGIITV